MTTHTDLIARLRVIANAIADGNYSELTMRIPAEPDRDADIVVMRSALAIESLEQQVVALTKERGIAKHNEQCTHGANKRILKELIAAQAREVKLLKTIRDEATAIAIYGEPPPQWMLDLIALHAADSALMERLKEERERCAVVAKRYEPDERADGVDYPSDAIRSMT